MRNPSNPLIVIGLGAAIALVAPFYPTDRFADKLMDIGAGLITGGLGGAVFARASETNIQKSGETFISADDCDPKT